MITKQYISKLSIPMVENYIGKLCYMVRTMSTLFLCSLLSYTALTQDQRVAYAVRVDDPIIIDGSLSDPGWSQSEIIDVGLEVDPRENAPAPQKTDVRIAYDDDMLYVRYVCFETDMDLLRARISDRDRMYQDDFILFILDTYGDSQKGYQFAVNPKNIQGDALRSGNNEDESFEMIWYSAAAIQENSWIVEMAIPFKSIRFPEVPEQNWNILVGRNYPRETRAMLSASPLSRDEPCLMCQGIRLRGIQDVKSSMAMEFLPYTIGTQQGNLLDREDPTTPFEQGKILGRAGVGVKLAPTPDIVVEGVLNPDFSQIESDAAQISVNTTFALF
jgi:hypothetical protein